MSIVAQHCTFYIEHTCVCHFEHYIVTITYYYSDDKTTVQCTVSYVVGKIFIFDDVIVDSVVYIDYYIITCINYYNIMHVPESLQK